MAKNVTNVPFTAITIPRMLPGAITTSPTPAWIFLSPIYIASIEHLLPTYVDSVNILERTYNKSAEVESLGNERHGEFRQVYHLHWTVLFLSYSNDSRPNQGVVLHRRDCNLLWLLAAKRRGWLFHDGFFTVS